ncbi:subtilisin-like serine protease [Colletotrichum asianum]|uniref:Subtilisin-like serine protease n=1 Tax=Colletotrichum asianum TaxID=702518 RepID=A0A8H3WH40_9PEZI|nr:subtilisin-like serine protease [Colletotrichum asianum]
MGTWSTFTPRSYGNTCKPNQSIIPFQSRMLKTEESLDSLLRASYVAKHAAFRDALQKDNISPPKPDDEEFLNTELGQGRLHELVDRLWIAGKPRPPNALHFQRVLGRDITVVEAMDLHLVCSHTQFYAKPIPPFSLEPTFWTRHLSCRDGCDCSDNPSNSCSRRTLWKPALGFLYSYRALIRHESDFRLAQDNYLLPGQIKWTDWKRFVAELNTKHTDGQIHKRFMYGELHRSRLNKLLSIRSNFKKTRMSRGGIDVESSSVTTLPGWRLPRCTSRLS